MKFIKIFLLLSAIFIIFALVSFASTKALPVVTVINPIRYSQLQKDKGDSLAGLKDQWQVTHDAGINATWLWQYSTLEDKKLTDFAKSQMQNQEFGLFLEIDRNFANKANVQYRGQGPWYFSDGLLLTSYDKAEREKLIDTAFAKFKSVFGFYPKTAGAWWVGADSIDYMQKKYGIVATLKASDQFNLDAYSIWGTPWSIPYISSKENAGIPADSLESSSNVVMLQWAARDPLRGYDDSLYSLQDYTVKGYDISYFKYLVQAYLKQPLDQIVIGLEDDFPAGSYQSVYKERLSLVKEWEKSGRVNVLLAKDYAQNFLAQKKTIVPTNYFLTKDFKTNNQSFWFNGTNFRAGIEKINDNIFLVDLRNYSNKVNEDFSTLPNSQGFLRISDPAVIDSVRFPSQKLQIGQSTSDLQIKQDSNGIELYAGNKKIALFTPIKLQLYDSNAKSFDFTPPQKSVGVFWILFFVVVAYFLFVFRRIGNLSKVVVQVILLLIPLLLAYPFLGSGQGYIFDRKELVLFFIPVIQSLSLQLKIMLVFQVMPFLLLLLAHYIFIIRSKSVRNKLFYYIFLSLIILLFAHVFYFPLDKSTYIAVSGVFVILAFVLLSFIVAIVYKKESLKILLISSMCASLIFGLMVIVVFFSRQKFIITPFEMEALNAVAGSQKQVLFVYPSGFNTSPIYKAVRPLLYDYTMFGEKLTGTRWQKIIRDGYRPLKFNSMSNSWVFVPRYLGADLSEKEISDNSLVKIFDNAQIAIFEKR